MVSDTDRLGSSEGRAKKQRRLRGSRSKSKGNAQKVEKKEASPVVSPSIRQAREVLTGLLGSENHLLHEQTSTFGDMFDDRFLRTVDSQSQANSKVCSPVRSAAPGEIIDQFEFLKIEI